mgnify:CR=1 FL=1
MPIRAVLDRLDGWVEVSPVGKRLWLHKFTSKPWLVVQGKSADWATELEAIESSPFFRYYLPQSNDKVVSVGAGIGTEAFFASKLVGPKGRVLAIEGDPTAFSQLVLGIQVNNLQNVLPFFGLVAESRRWAQFFMGDANGRDFTTSSIFSSEKSCVSLLAHTLDEVFEISGIKKVDFLLMNIEGAELLALKGLSALPKRIVVSCHDFLGNDATNTYEGVKDWLAQKNYRVQTFTSDPKKPWEEYYLFGEKSVDF